MTTIAFRVTPDDERALRELADRVPAATTSSIAREALALGLRALERQPSRLIRAKPEGK